MTCAVWCSGAGLLGCALVGTIWSRTAEPGPALRDGAQKAWRESCCVRATCKINPAKKSTYKKMTSLLAKISTIQYRKVTFPPMKSTGFHVCPAHYQHFPFSAASRALHYTSMSAQCVPKPSVCCRAGLRAPSSSTMQPCPLHSSAPPGATRGAAVVTWLEATKQQVI